MAFLKSKAGYRGCYGIYTYLNFTKEGNWRSIGLDTYNIRDRGFWWEEMDRTREAEHGDACVPAGKRSRQYYHFILSPAEKDNATLDQVRKMARTWVATHFCNGEQQYEVAIVYHNDNGERVSEGKEGLVHAHVVVNSVSLTTGKKLQISNAKADSYADSLQSICKKMGLTAYENTLENAKAADRSYKRRNRKFDAVAEVSVSSAERRIERRGGETWKASLREAIEGFASVSVSLEELKARMAPFGFGVVVKSEPETKKEWILFTTPKGRKASEGLLGARYTRARIGELFLKVSWSNLNGAKYEGYPDEVKARLDAAKAAKLAEAAELSELLRIVIEEDITNMGDFDVRKSELLDFNRAVTRATLSAKAELDKINELYDSALMIAKTEGLEEEYAAIRGFGAAKRREDFLFAHGDTMRYRRSAIENLERSGYKPEDARDILGAQRVKGGQFLELQAQVEGSAWRLQRLEKGAYLANKMRAEHAARENAERAAKGIPPRQPAVVKVMEPPKEYPNAKKAPLWVSHMLTKEQIHAIGETSRATRSRMRKAGERKLPPYAKKGQQIRKSIEAQRNVQLRERQLERRAQAASAEKKSGRRKGV